MHYTVEGTGLASQSFTKIANKHKPLKNEKSASITCIRRRRPSSAGYPPIWISGKSEDDPSARKASVCTYTYIVHYIQIIVNITHVHAHVYIHVVDVQYMYMYVCIDSFTYLYMMYAYALHNIRGQLRRSCLR